MPIQRLAARPRGTRTIENLNLGLALLLILAACGPTPPISPRGSGSPDTGASSAPSATPLPTARFTNVPDPALIAVIPTEIGGRSVTIPSLDEFGLTPGDIGQVYGEIGLRFRSLQVAFIGRPHLLSLYAMRMEPSFATTGELEPFLAAAGQYVGIAGLHREPWSLQVIGGHLVWARPGDDAMIADATLYTWASDGSLFLMVGVETAQDAAMIAALPGEAGPSASPSTGGSPAPGG